MILPFVRELIADLEPSAAFERVRRHLAGGTGRRRVSGLTATARALYLPLFVRAGKAPALVLVSDNKAAEALHAAVLAACELTGALDARRCCGCRRMMCCRLRMCRRILRFRSSARSRCGSWLAGSAKLVIAPMEAACMRLFGRDYYAALGAAVARG